MADSWLLICGLSLATLSIRLGGFLLGARLPDDGSWARALNALPGCLITALLTVILMQAGPDEWLAAALSLAIAVVTRSLPLTMLVGIAALSILRTAL